MARDRMPRNRSPRRPNSPGYGDAFTSGWWNLCWRSRIVRRAKTSQHAIAMADSSAGAQWPRSTEAATAQLKAVRFAATSYAGATKLLLRTWATAITSPQANVTDSRKLTTGPLFLVVWGHAVLGGYAGGQLG